MSLLHDQFAGPVLSLLSVQNIESELSYAYLHAVAAQAGVSCTQGSRHEDNHGIDARLLGLAPFPAQGKRTEARLAYKAAAEKATDAAFLQTTTTVVRDVAPGQALDLTVALANTTAGKIRACPGPIWW